MCSFTISEEDPGNQNLALWLSLERTLWALGHISTDSFCPSHTAKGFLSGFLRDFLFSVPNAPLGRSLNPICGRKGLLLTQYGAVHPQTLQWAVCRRSWALGTPLGSKGKSTPGRWKGHRVHTRDLRCLLPFPFRFI